MVVNKMPVFASMQRFVRSFLDLIYPSPCGGCSRSGSVLCSTCLQQFIPVQPPLCPICGSSLSKSGPCYHCQQHRLALTGLRVAFLYQDPLKTCIHNFKYHGNIHLALPLGLLLAHTLQTSDIQTDIIIPVPLHPQRQQERGYNQALFLAQICAQTLGIPLNSSLLYRKRATQAQAQLRPHDRYTNVAGAFSCSLPTTTTNGLVKRSIVIIDDVCTTGATLEACAAPLFNAGASKVWGLVLARPL